LRLLAEDATEILENKKEFKIGSISIHHANIRSLITSLELELGIVSETITYNLSP